MTGRMTQDRRIHGPLRALLLTLGCLVSLLVAAAPAVADSLVFVKDNNVWLANPDGSGQYQVTSDGTADNPYISPSQADDGTIVAGRHKPAGGPLYRMRQNGEVINTIPVGGMLAGPFAPQVSPDGKLVAFEHVFSRYVNGYLETSSDVRFTRADGSTPDGIGEVGRGAGAPSWIDSGRAFVGINSTATTVLPGAEPVQWWSDYDHQPQYFSSGMSVEDGEVAPNGDIVVVRGEQSFGTIQLYHSNGGYTTLPTPTCTLSEPSPGPAGQEFVDPTFSPSGDVLAWQEGNGVWEMDLGSNCGEGHPHLVIPDAREPDWGPAAVNPPPRGGSGSKPGQKGSGGRLAASVVGAKLAIALRKGLKVRFRAPGPGSVTVRATAAGKPVATGAKKLKKAGAATVVLPFSKSARKALAGRSAVSLGVSVKFVPLGGSPIVQQLAVKLKR